MKRAGFFLGLFLLMGLSAFVLCYRMATHPIREIPGDLPTELAWLRAEFHLDETTFAKVRALHDAYEPQCMENCERIVRVNERIGALATKGSPSVAEMDAVLAEAAELQRTCRGDMWRHIEAVAALLPPDKAQRYRTMMSHAIVQPGLPYPAALSH